MEENDPLYFIGGNINCPTLWQSLWSFYIKLVLSCNLEILFHGIYEKSTKMFIREDI